ncbi:hypothetical protein M0R45_009926 [Rubus argutus]|uniref:Uncharacterized protein n=1 Tax=Rubus argutus TaxID=59490 RepID=A0AAW1Y8X4_RUBAR
MGTNLSWWGKMDKKKGLCSWLKDLEEQRKQKLAKMWDEVKKLKKYFEKLENFKRFQVAVGLKLKGRYTHSIPLTREFNPQMEQLHARGYKPQSRVVIYDLDEEENEPIILANVSACCCEF